MKSIVPFEAVVFDCDGLLLDTERSWEKGEARLLANYGHEYTREIRLRLLGVSTAEAGRIFADILGTPERDRELLAELHGICRGILLEEARPMPGATELVGRLRGNVPMGVASNSPTDLVVEMLRQTGLLDAFDVVLGSDDVDEAKPAPDLYLLACAKLGADPKKSVALEDSPTGARAARAGGMRVIGVPSEPGTNLEADVTASSLSDDAVWGTLFV